MTKEELKSKAIELNEEGFSYGKIAEQLGVGKTTVHSWIKDCSLNEFRTNVPNGETPDKNDFSEQNNELSTLKDELENEFGTDNDLSALVDLRKAEMKHELEMERLEMERKKMNHEQLLEEKQIDSEQLEKEIQETRTLLENERLEKERLTSVVEELTIPPTAEELDEELYDSFLEHISDYLKLEDEQITCDEVEAVLESNRSTTKKITKWVKKQKLDRSDFLEIETLVNIKNSLSEMLNEFEIQEEDDLVFEFDSEFEIQLKEKYSLV